MTLSGLETAWLAGLLEGEGHFGMQTENGRRCRPLVTVGMTDPDVVERAHRMMGGSIRTSDRRPGEWKPMHTVSLTGMAAVDLMQSLYDSMGYRRQCAIQDVIHEYALFWMRPCAECAREFFAQAVGQNGRAVCCSEACHLARKRQQARDAATRHRAR